MAPYLRVRKKTMNVGFFSEGRQIRPQYCPTSPKMMSTLENQIQQINYILREIGINGILCFIYFDFEYLHVK